MTKISERDATEVPVQPQVIKLKEVKFKCLHILSLPFNLHPKDHFKFQIFNHFTFEVLYYGMFSLRGSYLFSL